MRKDYGQLGNIRFNSVPNKMKETSSGAYKSEKNISILLAAALVFCMPAGLRAGAFFRPGQLYAQSAVLMDADSGRILFEKNGYEQRPMASTTKIMT